MKQSRVTSAGCDECVFRIVLRYDKLGERARSAAPPQSEHFTCAAQSASLFSRESPRLEFEFAATSRICFNYFLWPVCCDWKYLFFKNFKMNGTDDGMLVLHECYAVYFLVFLLFMIESIGI